MVHRRGRRRSIKASNSKDKTRNIAPSSMMKVPEDAVPAADECGPPPPQTFWPRPTKMSSTLRVSSVYTTHGRSNRFNRVTASRLMTGVEPALESSTCNLPMPSDGRVKQIQGLAAQGWCRPRMDGLLTQTTVFDLGGERKSRPIVRTVRSKARTPHRSDPASPGLRFCIAVRAVIDVSRPADVLLEDSLA